MNRLFRNLVAGAIVIQLAILDAGLMLNLKMGGAGWLKFNLYAFLFFIILISVKKG